MSTLAERLRHRDWFGVFDRAVRDAVSEGPAGEAALVAVLDDLPRDHRPVIIAALGDARGDRGAAALRTALADAEGERSQDMRCAAALALAKRCGPEATPDLVRALAARSAAVKNYAMLGLAGAGDDRGWEQALARLQQLWRRRGLPAHYAPASLSAQSKAAAAICYLGRHLDGAGGDRTVRLVGELRAHRNLLGAAEQAWLTDMWPDCAPDGLPADQVSPPDGGRLQAWIRHPLFGTVH